MKAKRKEKNTKRRNIWAVRYILDKYGQGEGKGMDWEQAWLTFKKQNNHKWDKYFDSIHTNQQGMIINTALKELKRAAREILGMEMKDSVLEENGGIILELVPDLGTGTEGFHVKEENGRIYIRSEGEAGLLYGSFACIRRLQMEEDFVGFDKKEVPLNPLRMLNHWDNMDGSIERGYSGDSFFFRDQKVLVNDRTREYARLAASVGINGVVINNVNVKGNATRLIDQSYGEELKELADIFKKYGIRLFLSLNFAAPMELSGLSGADPLNEGVREWWKAAMTDIYERIPGLGGFLVKADSEGRPGPFTYGRTHADGANMLAEAVEPYGGLIIWRCFVYNCMQDWRDKKTDRARSCYDHFKPLDGDFRKNVVLQIKNGPMDFQVREPVSPLFGAMEHTNQMLEVQLAQEYTGQQRHVCYLIPMFKEVLEFRCGGSGKDRVRDVISGGKKGRICCGMAAVANTGNDENWTGHDLAAANWYGFGRLSFQMDLTPEDIAKEWIGCTFGPDRKVMETIKKILLMSWPAYEKYTSPLGIGWMVNPGHHYGPNVDGYEYDRWGTYHRADHLGIGIDRSGKGTGYALQYREPYASIYGDMKACPDELLLFFHHVSYVHRLKSGKTVIQHIYDSHFEGAEEAKEMAAYWESLQGKIPEIVYKRVKKRFDHQKEHAAEWRDQINSYFFRKSMIADEKHRIIY